MCLLKAKFFREQEFARRCKEEAFVGLTLNYSLHDNTFSKRYPFPLIMFIDMPHDCNPSEYSLNRLTSFGWSLSFTPQELLHKLFFMSK